MDKKIIDNLKSSVSYIVENLLFMLDDDKEINVCKEEQLYCSEIGFSGLKKGKLIIASTEKFLKISIQNLVCGENEDVYPKDMLSDISNELANNVCGTFLTSYFGDEVFDLTPPIFFEKSLKKMYIDEYVSFSIDGESFFAKIIFDKGEYEKN